MNQLSLIQSLTCIACGDILIDPITLSCGNSICSQCFPITSPTSIKKAVFRCPAPHCDSATHLFGPEMFTDAILMELTYSLRNLLLSSSVDDKQNYSPNEKQLVKHTNTIASHLHCSVCTNPISDAVTTPCGHTFCRICVLQSKINHDACHTCHRPLPKFSSLSTQPQSQLVTRIIKEFQLSGLLPFSKQETEKLNSLSLYQENMPLFVSGAIIMPGQTYRLPIFAPNHLRMFHQVIVPSSRYNGLCLVSVHRSRPQVAQFGTILQIVGLEKRSDAIILDVIGVDRFRLESHREEAGSQLIGTLEILHEPVFNQSSLDISLLCPSEFISTPPSPALGKDEQMALSEQKEHLFTYTTDLAETILQYIQHFASVPTLPTHVLHAETAGLLGPLWLESVKSLHGPMPSKFDPVAVCWWAAAALPVPPNELYILLRTVPLIERLELIISWMQGLQFQWEKCRSIAIHAFSQATEQQI
ncbi:PUA-like domain-containing protein [Choanephora cucurbitarum]|nr:PUA-like domain-containing protein [Choanephora cucurbitarum]